MYQAGEVDYLVATDAIGMGLNMDVDHVAFAGLSKFDGHRRRRLTPAEMAQIAGRAGRHQRDGTFGSLTLEGDALAEFRPEEIEGIEEHRFAPLDFLYWRESELDFHGVDGAGPLARAAAGAREVRAAPEAVDLAVLKILAADPELAGRAAAPDLVRRMWAACGLPDFRKTGPEHHARLVARIFAHLSEATAISPMAGTPPRWRGSTMSRATSRPSPTASPGCGPGPISPTAPTGWPIRRRWPSGPWRSRRNCPTRCTSGSPSASSTAAPPC